MRGAGISPNVISYNALLNTCEKKRKMKKEKEKKLESKGSSSTRAERKEGEKYNGKAGRALKNQFARAIPASRD